MYSLDALASKQEEWNNKREAWERISGMRDVVPKLKEHLEKSTLNDTAVLLLTQGIDEYLRRVKEVFMNFAVTAALLLSVELSLLFSPTEALSNGPSWLFYCFMGSMSIATVLHLYTVISVIHLLNWWMCFKRDSDFLLYSMEYDINAAQSSHIVYPLIVGMVFTVVGGGCALAAFGQTTSATAVIFAGVVPVGIFLGTSTFFAKSTSISTLGTFIKRCSLDDVAAVMEIYEEMAHMDQQLTLRDTPTTLMAKPSDKPMPKSGNGGHVELTTCIVPKKKDGAAMTLSSRQRSSDANDAAVINSRLSTGSTNSGDLARPTRPRQTALPAGWDEHTSGEGRAYYVNRATNETTWTPP